MNVLFLYYKEPLEKIIDSQDELNNLSDFSKSFLDKFQNQILRKENRFLLEANNRQKTYFLVVSIILVTVFILLFRYFSNSISNLEDAIK
jgi:hypothetical protein